MNMRDKIVQAIGEARCRITGGTVMNIPSDNLYADVILSVLENPTEEMIEAGVRADYGKTIGSRCENTFRAMIRGVQR